MSFETTSARPVHADVSGGVLALVEPPGWSGDRANSVVRLSGSSAATPWEYVAPSSTSQTSPPIQSGIAQATDGTTYLVESRDVAPSGNSEARFVALNGSIGAATAKTVLPLSTYDIHPGPHCDTAGFSWATFFTGETHYRNAPDASDVAISKDGAAYVEISESHLAWSPVCSYVDVVDGDGNTHLLNNWEEGQGTLSRSLKLTLMRLDSQGTVSATTLAEWSFSGVDTQSNFFAASPYTNFGQVTPDGRDGVLASWTKYDPTTSGYESHITDVTVNAVTDHVLPVASDIAALGEPPVALVDGDGTAVLEYRDTDGSGIREAIETDTWTPKWTLHTDARPFLSVADGHTILLDAANKAWIDVDSTGVTTVTPLQTSVSDPVVLFHSQGLLVASDNDTNAVVLLITPYVRDAGYYFTTHPRSAESKCETPPMLVRHTNPQTHQQEGHTSLIPRPEGYSYRFDGDWTGLEDQKAAVVSAFTEWNYMNAKQGPQTFFTQLADTAVGGDILIRRRSLPSTVEGYKTGGRFVPGQLQAGNHILGGIMLLNTDESAISKPRGYYKAALHEIGHALGLDHFAPEQPSFHGSSVLNGMAYRKGDLVPSQQADDPLNNIPMFVTSCDADAARVYSTR